MTRKFERFGDVSAHMGFMVLCCGNSFPKVGPYGDDQEQNLEIAFARLRDGLPLVAKKLHDASKLAEVEKLIDASLDAYRSGERKRGAHLLQDIENIVHPTRFAEYAARKGEPL
jgi:hypothetical protein